MLLIGLPIAAIVALSGLLLLRRMDLDRFTPEQPGVQPSAVEPTDQRNIRVMRPRVVVLLVGLPVLQIALGTLGTGVIPPDTFARRLFSLMGAPSVAMLTAVVVAHVVVGSGKRWDLGRRAAILDSALPQVAVIVFTTGAGGVFAAVLVATGVGQAFSELMIQWHMPMVVAGFLVSLGLRAAQGSATVSILTTAGLLSGPITSAGYTEPQTVFVALAICFGSLGLSHVNDSGFWIVTKYLGMSVREGLRTWTLATTVLGSVGFAICATGFALAS